MLGLLLLPALAGIPLLGPPPFFRKEPGKEVFRPGARILWLGDSITHACRYTRYLEDYAWSRYPDNDLRFLNTGVSGDRALDVLLRFDLDVRPFHPDTIFLCLGMNDGGFTTEGKEERFAIFRRHMSLLLDRIRDGGSRCVLISPPPVDPDAVFPLKGLPIPRKVGPGYDRVLKDFSEWLEDEAKRRRIPFVDAHGALSSFTRRLRFANPASTLVPDGVHPGRIGAALMALEVLDRIGERGPRFVVELIRGVGRGKIRGADLRKLRWPPSGVRFVLKARSLPWVLPRPARGAAPLDPRYEALNRSVLRIRDLVPGRYGLYIDGIRILSATSRDLARGIDLGLEDLHPDWRQAESLTEENGRRNAVIRTGILDLSEARQTARNLEARGLTAGPAYRRAKARIEELNALLAEVGRKVVASEKRIARLRTPRPHDYEIRLETRRTRIPGR